MEAPPQLILSALTWVGSPTTIVAGDSEEHIGSYVQSAHVRLNRGRMNTQLEAVEYTPATATSFKYTRHAFVGTASSEVTYYGAILAEDMSPVMRICLPDRRPWPEKFQPDDDVDRPLSGPPFNFYDSDWRGEHGIHPEMLSGIHITAPDLPGQGDTDAEPDHQAGDEPDSQEGSGWQGPWVTTLLQKQDRRQLLGEVTKIVWDAHGDDRGLGVELRLRAVRLTEYHDGDPEATRAISDYDIQATILRVFATSEGLLSLHGAEEEEEEE
ncbi:hypothetical protein FB451DRAFT_429901 [Mycena latifolia]|nr:hypothetical protein FB451DRAFT_429901 [Mycena latifolia]